MSSRPPVFSWNEEIHFGPPSEPITIRAFFEEAQALHSRNASSDNTSTSESFHNLTGWEEWKGIQKDAREHIEEDCDLEDIKSRLSTVLMSQKRVSYLQKMHAAAVNEVSGKRKKEKVGNVSAKQEDPDFDSFKEAVERTQLNIWRLRSAAKPYIRSGHISDQNALDTLKLKGSGLPGSMGTISHEVLITFTAYTKNTWYPYAFSRNAQHVLTSSNTLADLWSCIPCPFRGDGNLPKEVIETDPELDSFGRPAGQSVGRVVGYTQVDSSADQDQVVIVIEDVAYSDGRGSPDYADKLVSHFEAFTPTSNRDIHPQLQLGPYERPARAKPPIKGLTFDSVTLHSIALRINEPYWILHRGSCEHWFVIDEIRLQNPRDPAAGYPIGLQQTPTFRPLCRVCAKAPATLSVLNDVRLGETPGMVCHPCWELFGGLPPSREGDELAARVVVVPMIFETS